MRFAALLFTMLSTALAQPPAFEVATLKPVELTPGNYSANLGSATNGVVNLTNVTLSDSLRYAYAITNDQQIVGPDWIRDKDIRFNIQGKAAANTPLPRLREMLQTLLIERFHISLRREPRNMSHLAMVVLKEGHKLRPVVEGSTNAGNQSRVNIIVSNRIQMIMLATLLSRFTKETILDETGLSGFYEVNLEWSPEGSDIDGPPLFSAIQQQLGLKLERRKGPVEVLVVDRAEKVPLPN